MCTGRSALLRVGWYSCPCCYYRREALRRQARRFQSTLVPGRGKSCRHVSLFKQENYRFASGGKARFHPRLCPTEGVGQAVESRRLAEEIVVEISLRLSARETTPSLWARSHRPPLRAHPDTVAAGHTQYLSSLPRRLQLPSQGADAPPDGRAPDSDARSIKITHHPSAMSSPAPIAWTTGAASRLRCCVLG